MIKCLCEVNYVGIVTVLDYYWPPGNTSEGRPSALGDPGTWSQDDVYVWILGAEDVDGWGWKWGGGRMEQDGVRFNRAIQNNVQFKTYKLFISGTFYLIFSYRSWPQVIETKESKTMDKSGPLYTDRYSEKKK